MWYKASFISVHFYSIEPEDRFTLKPKHVAVITNKKKCLFVMYWRNEEYSDSEYPNAATVKMYVLEPYNMVWFIRSSGLIIEHHCMACKPIFCIVLWALKHIPQDGFSVFCV